MRMTVTVRKSTFSCIAFEKNRLSRWRYFFHFLFSISFRRIRNNTCVKYIDKQSSFFLNDITLAFLQTFQNIAYKFSLLWTSKFSLLLKFFNNYSILDIFSILFPNYVCFVIFKINFCTLDFVINPYACAVWLGQCKCSFQWMKKYVDNDNTNFFP